MFRARERRKKNDAVHREQARALNMFKRALLKEREKLYEKED